MKVVVVSAEVPPALDGIGDHTAFLSAELARVADVTVLTGRKEPLPIPGVAVNTVFDPAAPGTVRGLARSIGELGPDAVFLQYNPFSYGPRGWNPHLPMAMRQLRRESPNCRILLMVHEPMAWAINWKLALMTLWHRAMLWSLGRSSSVVLFTIEPWVRRFGSWFPGRRLGHLPVGSNIRRVSTQRKEARDRLGIAPNTAVVGVFGIPHNSRRLDWVRDSAAGIRDAGRDVLVLHMGPRPDEARAVMGDLPVRADGVLPADEVSRRLTAVDVYPVPLADGISTRRTTLMAALEHGLPIVATAGPLTDRVLREQDGQAFSLCDVADQCGFVRAATTVAQDEWLSRRLAAGAAALHAREFTWPAIAAKLMPYLG